MRYFESKAPDFNWVTLRIAGAEIKAKKHSFKATRTTQKVRRYGNPNPVARTIGIADVDDTTIEFDWIGALSLLNALGVTDYNLVEVKLAGLKFEMTEDIRDPEKNPLKSAGGLTNTAKNCEIVGIEWNSEAGENASPLTVTVSILGIVIAKGDLGGAGMSMGA